MISRRKFIKAFFAAAGLTALGGFGTKSWAGGSPQNNESTNRLNPAQNMDYYSPQYLALEVSGELQRRERLLHEKLDSCNLCPRNCGVNRRAGRTGVCSTPNNFKVASFGPHFGEERPLVGRNGSGTIFFSDCSLLCIFCQNWQIAHRGDGRVTSHAELAQIMLTLQERGAHNINLVTPTHIVPHIVSALRIAISRGLNTPLLYNTSGYDNLETIQLLDGIVDIYLPDYKFLNSEAASAVTNNSRNIAEHTGAAIKEMHRQVGTLQLNNGIAYRGLLIRHLVLPSNFAGTDIFVRWVVNELGPATHVNIMAQYSPQYQARDYPPLNQRLAPGEYEQAMRWARDAGLRNFH